MIWVSKLIPNDPDRGPQGFAGEPPQAMQESLSTMKDAGARGLRAGGAVRGGFVKADDAKYQIIRDMNDTAKKLAAQSRVRDRGCAPWRLVRETRTAG